jgi:hypothetical protein
MKLTEFSIRRPLVILAITVAIGIFGLFAYSSMGVAKRQFPIGRGDDDLSGGGPGDG